MKKLDKKVNLYAFLRRLFTSAFIIFPVIILLSIREELNDTLKVALIVLFSIAGLFVIVGLFIIPFFTYKTHRYKIEEERIIIKQGVLFQKKIIIPIKRIEHIEKRQDPIQLLLKQSSAIFVTAGSTSYIFGLSIKDVDEILNEVQNKLKDYLIEDETDE